MDSKDLKGFVDSILGDHGFKETAEETEGVERLLSYSWKEDDFGTRLVFSGWLENRDLNFFFFPIFHVRDLKVVDLLRTMEALQQRYLCLSTGVNAEC